MKRFLPYLRYMQPYRWLLIGGLLCGAISGFASGGGLPWVMNKVFPRIFSEGPRDLASWQIAGYALLIPAIFLVRATMAFLNNYLMSRCGLGVLESLRVDLF